MNDKQHNARGHQNHPGSGRGRPLFFPKGRLLGNTEQEAVRSLLGDTPRRAGGARPARRDLLIEYLHLIQDTEGCLPAGHLHALADELKISMAEVYEVASFYAHFDIVHDGDARPAPVTIRVCDSLSCMLAGAEQLIAKLETAGLPEVRILRAPCMGRCDNAPVCEVGHRHVDHADKSRAEEVVAAGDFTPVLPSYKNLQDYSNEGGYEILRQCLDGKHTIDDVITTLSDGGLRGLGGAGFPTGRKWQFVRAEPKPRLMAVNADEGEPGTFKDRYHLERDPHGFLEGMLIGAWAIEADGVYIYLRDEYPAVREILTHEIGEIEKAGLSGHTKIHLRRGAGAYICGEESAMIESIEGKRGLPRHRPPYVSTNGLFGRPTLVNNVETLYWVPEILRKGADWFATQGKNGAKGLRSYSVSGRVKEPGVKVVPAGTTARELVEAHSGGMQDGHEFRAYLPGGASGGILPARMADLPLDFGTLEKHGCFVGSHAVIILSDKDDMRAVALNLIKFFALESCGQCTPCRNGCEQAAHLMSNDKWDQDVLNDLAQVMADASICGLGQAAPNTFLSVMKYFQEDVS